MSEYLLADEITELAARVVEENAKAGRKVATAESCTGGLVAGALTEIAGSSAVLDRGFCRFVFCAALVAIAAQGQRRIAPRPAQRTGHAIADIVG